MSIILFFGAVFVSTGLIVFLSARRFSPLVMALAAGSLIAGFWAERLATVIDSAKLSVPGLPSGLMAATALILLPLLLSLFIGAKYSRKLSRIIAALIVAFMASAVLIQPFGRYVTMEQDTLRLFRTISEYWQYVMTAALVAAMIDALCQGVKLPHGKKNH